MSLAPAIRTHHGVILRISGTRLIHAYETVDFDTLWDIIRDDLPPLIVQVESILAEHP